MSQVRHRTSNQRPTMPDPLQSDTLTAAEAVTKTLGSHTSHRAR
jgi:hypothetical protein